MVAWLVLFDGSFRNNAQHDGDELGVLRRCRTIFETQWVREILNRGEESFRLVRIHHQSRAVIVRGTVERTTRLFLYRPEIYDTEVNARMEALWKSSFRIIEMDPWGPQISCSVRSSRASTTWVTKSRGVLLFSTDIAPRHPFRNDRWTTRDGKEPAIGRLCA